MVNIKNPTSLTKAKERLGRQKNSKLVASEATVSGKKVEAIKSITSPSPSVNVLSAAKIILSCVTDDESFSRAHLATMGYLIDSPRCRGCGV